MSQMWASEGKDSGSTFCGDAGREASDSEAVEMSMLQPLAARKRTSLCCGKKGTGWRLPACLPLRRTTAAQELETSLDTTARPCHA